LEEERRVGWRSLRVNGERDGQPLHIYEGPVVSVLLQKKRYMTCDDGVREQVDSG
jgi:hypothetical protein